MSLSICNYYSKNNSKNNKNYDNYDNFNYDINLIKRVILNLLKWIDEINTDKLSIINIGSKFERYLNKEFRKSKIKDIRKSVVLNVCRYLSTFNSSNDDYFLKYMDDLKYLLRKRPSRNISGITSITLLTAPFPDGQKFSCRHNCYYCPNEPAHKDNNWQAQPRSYLYKEPAVMRANQNNFLAIEQMLYRMDTLFYNGHIIDKIEIILEGGTYTEYPPEYLERFNRDIFYIANVYEKYREIIDIETDGGIRAELIKEKLLQIRQPLSICEETALNRNSKVHIIGISCETRPDAIDDTWLLRFRKWGITRIQIGMQHIDNTILKIINRGHTIEQAMWAMNYLKDNCFKIDIHIMPDLPGSNPEKDKEMFDYVYKFVCPDEMKIYPCEVVPWTVIEKWYRDGKYQPYFDKNPGDLFDVIKYAMIKCPNYIRLPRIIRDIPKDYIESGNTFSNMRQMIDNELSIEKTLSLDMRAREIGRNPAYYKNLASYNVHYNRANNGDDYFIAYESIDMRVLFGFIKLRLIDRSNCLTSLEVLKGCALIRELHVYGDTTAVGINNHRGSQHIGIGKKLLQIAEQKAMSKGFYKIAIISGEGVKNYYKKFGYYEEDTFMIKKFWILQIWLNQIFNLIEILFCTIN